MTTPADLERFLPTVARAVEAGIELPNEPPFASHQLAALLVHGRFLRRDGWSEVKMLSELDFGALETEPPKEGRAGSAAHVLGGVLSRSSGGVLCRIHHYADEIVELHDVYVPKVVTSCNELWHFERALEALALRATPPEALRVTDFSAQELGGAYRSGPTQAPPEFHGFQYQDALTEAMAAAGRVAARGELLGVDIRVYAWPLLWLRYGEQHPVPDLVLLADPHGQLRAVGGVLP